MISFEDATLVLRKWREESASLDVFLAEERLLTVVGRCVVVDFLGFMLTLGNADIVRISLGLVGAEFRYEDQRARLRFVNSDVDLRDAVCALRIQFPTGLVAMLVERQQ